MIRAVLLGLLCCAAVAEAQVNPRCSTVPCTRQPFQTAVQRPLDEKALDIMSVKDFGAKCDGVTNDSAAMQAAITAAGTAGKVVILAGCVGTFTNPNNIWVEDQRGGQPGAEPYTALNPVTGLPYTGAVARTVPSKLSDAVSVKDFGAPNDGVTNASTQIQNAITAVVVPDLLGGPVSRQKLIMPGGTYLLRSPLTVPSGKGFSLDCQGAVLTYAPLSGGAGTIGFRFGDAANLSGWMDVRNCIFDCTQTTGGATLLSGAACVQLDSWNQGIFTNNYIWGPLNSGCSATTGPCDAYGLRITSSNASCSSGGFFNQRSTFTDLHLQGDFDVGFEIDNPNCPNNNFALEHVMGNVTILHSTVSAGLLNMRKTIGFHFGPSTFTIMGTYFTASGFDVGISFGGKGFRGFWSQPENNGLAVLFRSELPSTFTVVQGNEITVDSPGNNGTLVIGQAGFPWVGTSAVTCTPLSSSPCYETCNNGPCQNGVGAWRTNPRGGGLIGIYRLANVPGSGLDNPCLPGTAASGGPTSNSNPLNGCSSIGGTNSNGTVDGRCCWQYYADLNASGTDAIRFNTVRRFGEFTSNILTGDNGTGNDQGEQGSVSPVSGAGPTGNVTWNNPSNADLDFVLQTGWPLAGGTERTANLGFNTANGVRQWNLSKSPAAPATLSVNDVANGIINLTFNPNAPGVQIGTTTFAALPAAPVNGMIVYCSNCTIANPCAGTGSGALAKRLNGVWVCN